MKLTKLAMARVIVMALYGTDKLPAADNINVRREMNAHNWAGLAHRHALAMKIIAARPAKEAT